MVCANPDVVVERGHELVYCAGAIADLYGSLGGEVLYAGKPYRPIYEQALAVAENARGGDDAACARAGDRRFGAHRSAGAARARHRLPVRHRRHPCAESWASRDDPDPAALADMFAAANLMPKAVTRKLVW